jgi:hypothetical protein
MFRRSFTPPSISDDSNLKMEAARSLEVYQCFRGPCCLYHKDDVGALISEAAETSETLVNFY